jgi:hypothetical protein
MSPPPSGSKACGKQGNRLEEISDYIGTRREMEDNNSVPVDSPVGQNEPPVPIGSHTKQSEPIGDKDRITSRTSNPTLIICVGGCFRIRMEALKNPQGPQSDSLSRSWNRGPSDYVTSTTRQNDLI